jgi:hypothetical protein
MVNDRPSTRTIRNGWKGCFVSAWRYWFSVIAVLNPGVKMGDRGLEPLTSCVSGLHGRGSWVVDAILGKS